MNKDYNKLEMELEVLRSSVNCKPKEMQKSYF